MKNRKSSKKPKISIIIPVKEVNDYIREFVPIILKQDYEDFEIIILPDKKSVFKAKKTKIISSGPGGPAKKRDLGAKLAKGDVLFFIDDDAYPVRRDLLDKALKYFDNPEIAAVGGPNITPPESNVFQKVSGDVLASYLVGGTENHRYKPGLKKECYDLPSCNLFVRKSTFKDIGGFDTGFWPGEDTKLCLDIKNLGKKIMYDPEVAVYHHRRPNLKGYLKQIFAYAKHRGYFVKKYPETSLKLPYFVPSAFVIGLVLGLFLSFLSRYIFTIYTILLTIYFVLLIIEAVRTEKPANILMFISIVFLTHITYGIGFIKGIFKKELRSIYRK